MFVMFVCVCVLWYINMWCYRWSCPLFYWKLIINREHWMAPEHNCILCQRENKRTNECMRQRVSERKRRAWIVFEIKRKIDAKLLSNPLMLKWICFASMSKCMMKKWETGRERERTTECVCHYFTHAYLCVWIYIYR